MATERKNHDDEGVPRVSGGESNFARGEYISRSVGVCVCVCAGICGSPEGRWQKAVDWERREGARKGGSRFSRERGRESEGERGR